MQNVHLHFFNFKETIQPGWVVLPTQKIEQVESEVQCHF